MGSLPGGGSVVGGGSGIPGGGVASGTLPGGGSVVGASLPSEDGPHGVMGFFQNLGTSGEKALAGLIPGMEMVGTAIGKDFADFAKDPLHGGKGHSRLIFDVLKPMAQAEANYWRPLGQGKWSEFGHNVYNDPLTGILDLAAGAGTAAKVAGKVGTRLADAGLIAEDSRLATLNKPGKIELSTGDGRTVTVETSERPLRRAAQVATDKALRNVPGAINTVKGGIVAPFNADKAFEIWNRDPRNLNYIGEFARAGRVLQRQTNVDALRRTLALSDYAKEFGKLSTNERIAWQIMARVPIPRLLEGWKQMLAETDPENLLLHAIDNPKIRELYDNPTPEMLKVHALADALGEKKVGILQDYGVFHGALADERKYRHARLASGARYVDKAETQAQADLMRQNFEHDITALEGEAKGWRQRAEQYLKPPKRDKTSPPPRLDEPTAAWEKETHDASKASVIAQHERDIEILQGRAAFYRKGAAEATDKLQSVGLEGLAKKAEAEAAKLRAQIDDFAKPTAYGKVPRRDTSFAEFEAESGRKALHREATRRATAIEHEIASRRTALEDAIDELEHGIVGGDDIHALRDEIAAAGRPQPIYLPDKMVEDLRGTRFGSGGKGVQWSRSGKLNRGVLFQMGRLALEPDVLGPAYLRDVKFALYSDRHNLLLDHAIEVEHLPKGYVYIYQRLGQKIPQTLKAEAQFEQNLAHLVPDDVRQGLVLIGKDASKAEVEGGRYLAVPEGFARGVTGEFTKSTLAISKFITEPLKVWRAIVLGLRVGFLVNNVVGNHLLYAIRQAGVDGARAYLNMIQDTYGIKKVRELLRIPGAPKGISRQLVEEFWPEQAHGTFVGTQMPGNQFGKVMKYGTAGLIPADRAIEAGLRRATIEAELRRSPEVRSFATKMRDEAREMNAMEPSFDEIVSETAKYTPELVDRISKKVNDTLGDYEGLTHFEQTVVRQLVPFYAWLKAITRITLTMPLDHPLRSAFLTKLSAIAIQRTEDQFGGPLPENLWSGISLGNGNLLRTTGMNPYMSVIDIASALHGLGFPPAGVSQANIAAAINQTNPFLAAAIGTVGSYSKGGGVIGNVGQTVGENLPVSRIAFPPESTLYQGNQRVRQTLGFLGVPIVKPDPNEAADRAGR